MSGGQNYALDLNGPSRNLEKKCARTKIAATTYVFKNIMGLART
jgi:hypothetical protein